jgi:hypothetical protein
MKNTHRLLATATAVMLASGSGWTATAHARALDGDDGPAITARVHGTFQDASGGLGVLSGDMLIVRFEVRDGAVAAVGTIVGALADSTGGMLGRVNQELTLPVQRVESTCNQMRLELAAADADVLNTPIHVDKEVAGFDSREGESVRPQALPVLCALGEVLRGRPAPDALARALNDVVSAAAR